MLFEYLHPVESFIPQPIEGLESLPDYWYEGRCPRSGEWHRLPRTPLVKAIANGLISQLKQTPCFNREGKMYGVLLVETPEGQRHVLRAFSGLLAGQSHLAGWVPPIPGREKVAFSEAYTLEQLGTIKQRLLALQQLPERQTYRQLSAEFTQRRQHLNQTHRQRKQQRAAKRQVLQATMAADPLQTAVAALEQESRRDKAELKALKQAQRQRLAPLEAVINRADQEIQALKAQRKALSRQLQTAMHGVYTLTNFAGNVVSLQTLADSSNLPTGTGDCCAPKLLHFAATYGLRPLAMAEFWWGPANSSQTYQPGSFHGACQERCQPIMGFLLSGLSALADGSAGSSQPLPMLYQDDWVIAVDKPSGLLSVPGRYGDNQDSVLSRLKNLLPNGDSCMAVHRLDQDTSGVLLLARNLETYRALSRQFQQRQVKKLYEAIVEGQVLEPAGMIDLPLWGDPQHRPYQCVDWNQGKASQTHYRRLLQGAESARIEFLPLTGRTHQLRVHAAHPSGLGAPIRGDRLYGQANQHRRLHLHARELSVLHPQIGETLTIRAEVPF
jgi:tRNA pseudouridine32 synthase/23S rRNA pseudouridine746 synthase